MPALPRRLGAPLAAPALLAAAPAAAAPPATCELLFDGLLRPRVE